MTDQPKSAACAVCDSPATPLCAITMDGTEQTAVPLCRPCWLQQRQQPEIPLELARRLLGPEWGLWTDETGIIFYPPDLDRGTEGYGKIGGIRVTIYDIVVLARNDIGAQCETAIARYRERQHERCPCHLWGDGVCLKCGMKRQQTQASTGHGSQGDPATRLVEYLHETASAEPAFCADCGATCQSMERFRLVPGGILCDYCYHRHSVSPGFAAGEGHPIPLDDRIASARAEYEKEKLGDNEAAWMTPSAEGDV